MLVEFRATADGGQDKTNATARRRGEPLVEYIEPPPNAVPDISATSEINLINAWNGEGAYAADHKKRQNYRIVAVVQQPNFLMVAANKKSDITDLSQVNTRTQPTWIAFTTRDTPVDHILAHYGISEEALKAKGVVLLKVEIGNDGPLPTYS